MRYGFRNDCMKRLPLILILLVAAFFRLYQLDRVPPSPSLDEVSIGYNAYSLLHTGKDEYGNSFPLLLRAYDDYRPALYVYLVVPFVWLFGLTAIAVRIPSVLLSLGVVYLVYRLGRLWGKLLVHSPWVGYVAAFLLAISPWHIYLSRLGHEANLGLTLVVLGMYWFSEFIVEKRDVSLLLSAASFGLSFHGYQSQKVIVPLLVGAGLLLFRNALFGRFRLTLIAGSIACVVALPAVIATISPEGLIRLRGTSAFDPSAGKTEAISIFLRNYFSHASPAWIFFGKDREAHKTPGLGLLYPWEIVGIAAGLIALWKIRGNVSARLFLLIWIGSAPVAAAIATGAPHAMRSYTAIPGVQLLEATGLVFLATAFPKMRARWAIGLLVFAAGLSLGLFWRGYFVRFPVEQSDSFQYAMRPAVAYALEHENEYQRIEFSHQGALYQSYMFYLFYSRLNPNVYLASGGTESGGYEATHYIGKYAFGFIPQNSREMKPNVLYFYDAARVPDGARVIQRFSNLDGNTAIAAATL